MEGYCAKRCCAKGWCAKVKGVMLMRCSDGILNREIEKWSFLRTYRIGKIPRKIAAKIRCSLTMNRQSNFFS